MKESATIYKPRLGLLFYACTAAGIATTALLLLTGHWLGIVLSPIGLLMILPFLACSYSIRGNILAVHSLFGVTELPIDRISEVSFCTGWLAADATSTRRVSIRFADRKVLKSAAPLEISPKDREAFVAHLLRVNPAIKIVQGKS